MSTRRHFGARPGGVLVLSASILFSTLAGAQTPGQVRARYDAEIAKFRALLAKQGGTGTSLLGDPSAPPRSSGPADGIEASGIPPPSLEPPEQHVDNEGWTRVDHGGPNAAREVWQKTLSDGRVIREERLVAGEMMEAAGAATKGPLDDAVQRVPTTPWGRPYTPEEMRIKESKETGRWIHYDTPDGKGEWHRYTPDGSLQIAHEDPYAGKTGETAIETGLMIGDRVAGGREGGAVGGIPDWGSAAGMSAADLAGNAVHREPVVLKDNLPPGVVGGHFPAPGKAGEATFQLDNGQTVRVPVNARGEVLGQVRVPRMGQGDMLWPPTPATKSRPPATTVGRYTVTPISQQAHWQARFTNHGPVDKSENGKWIRRQTPDGPEWVRYTADNKLIRTRQDPYEGHPEDEGWRHAMTKDGPMWFRRTPDGRLVIDYENDGKPPLDGGKIGENDFYGVSRTVEGMGWDPSKEDYATWASTHIHTPFIEPGGRAGVFPPMFVEPAGRPGEVGLLPIDERIYVDGVNGPMILEGHMAVRERNIVERYHAALGGMEGQAGIAAASIAGEESIRQAALIRERAGQSYITAMHTNATHAAGAQATNTWGQVIGTGMLTGLGTGLSQGLNVLGTNLGEQVVKQIFPPKHEPPVAVEPPGGAAGTPRGGRTGAGETPAHGTPTGGTTGEHGHTEGHEGTTPTATSPSPTPPPPGENVTISFTEFKCGNCKQITRVYAGEPMPASCPHCGFGPGGPAVSSPTSSGGAAAAHGTCRICGKQTASTSITVCPNCARKIEGGGVPGP